MAPEPAGVGRHPRERPAHSRGTTSPTGRTCGTVPCLLFSNFELVAERGVVLDLVRPVLRRPFDPRDEELAVVGHRDQVADLHFPDEAPGVARGPAGLAQGRLVGVVLVRDQPADRATPATCRGAAGGSTTR